MPGSAALAAALTAILEEAAAAGVTLTLWWRDDDAVAATPRLERLLALAAEEGVPVALAVIPAGLSPSLPERLRRSDRLTVLQHGWSHTNHEPPGRKPMELGPARPADGVLAELEAGRTVLERAFGERFLPVLVPPWNRAAPAVLEDAGRVGLPCASLFGGRAPDRFRIDTHIDPVAWQGGRGYAGDDTILAPLRAAVEAAAASRQRVTGPIGLLTHHLVHDADTSAALATLLRVTAHHPAARWTSATTLFPLSAAEAD